MKISKNINFIILVLEFLNEMLWDKDIFQNVF